jgi:hypothetical protein
MKHATVLGIAAAAALVGTAPAFAQANRTFVSGQGSDSNPCSLAAPCRSFAQALTQTNTGGEIVVLDSAGYGAVTINKAVSIVNQDGVEAGVTVSSGDGITVAAGAGDIVNLRGLTVVGLNSGINGVSFVSGQSLSIDKCEIRGFAGAGIAMSTTAVANLTVTDTTVSNDENGVSITATVPANPNSFTTVTLARLHASETGTGITINPPSGGVLIATVSDSLLDANGLGVFVNSSSVGTNLARVFMDNNKILTLPTVTSVSASGANTHVIFGRNLFTTTVFFSGGAQMQSWGNNLAYNGNAVTF